MWKKELFSLSAYESIISVEAREREGHRTDKDILSKDNDLSPMVTVASVCRQRFLFYFLLLKKESQVVVEISQ